MAVVAAVLFEEHRGVEFSIRLSEADLTALDEHVRAAGLPSRSAAVQRAIRLLTRPQLEQDYAAAWQEWDDSGDREAWEGVTADVRCRRSEDG